MKTENMYRVLVATIFILLMTIGIYIGVEITDNDKAKNNNENQEVVVSHTDSIEIYNEQAKIVQEEEVIDVNIKFTDVYPDCGHSIESA